MVYLFHLKCKWTWSFSTIEQHILDTMQENNCLKLPLCLPLAKMVVHFSPVSNISKNSSKINQRPHTATSNSSCQLLLHQKVEGKPNWKGKNQGPHQTRKPWSWRQNDQTTWPTSPIGKANPEHKLNQTTEFLSTAFNHHVTNTPHCKPPH